MGDSIIGRARENNILEMNFIDIRDFSTNKHRKVDDYPYSGGGGMLYGTHSLCMTRICLLRRDLIINRLRYICRRRERCLIKVSRLTLQIMSHIVLLCGHYEGIDQRVIDEIVDMELSVGDFVMTGGEIPAMTVIDTVSRLVPGVLAAETSYENESHFNGLLEYPQYTRPAVGTINRFPMYLFPVITRKSNSGKGNSHSLIHSKSVPICLKKPNLPRKI